MRSCWRPKQRHGNLPTEESKLQGDANESRGSENMDPPAPLLEAPLSSSITHTPRTNTAKLQTQEQQIAPRAKKYIRVTSQSTTAVCLEQPKQLGWQNAHTNHGIFLNWANVIKGATQHRVQRKEESTQNCTPYGSNLPQATLIR